MFARNDESAYHRPVTGVTMFAGRVCWYLRAFGRHPLVRTVDRLEALVVLGVLIAAILAGPIAMSAGDSIRETGSRMAEEQSHSRHPVQALVIGGVGLPTDMQSPASVQVQWRDGNHTRTESIAALATTKPGDHMTVWLDDDSGKVVTAPMRAGDAAVNGVLAALTVWITLVMCAALVAYFIRRGLDRARDRAWEREIRLFTHNDDGWANRHT